MGPRQPRLHRARQGGEASATAGIFSPSPRAHPAPPAARGRRREKRGERRRGRGRAGLFLIKRKLPFPPCENEIFRSMDLFTRLESGKNKWGRVHFLLTFTIGNDSAVEI